MTTTTITDATMTITSTAQATDAEQRINTARKKAKAFASFGADDEAKAASATADELEAALEQWTTAQTRERGAAVMPELHTIVRESRQREDEYIACMTTLVRLNAEMASALERFCKLRSIAALGGQDVSGLAKPQLPIPLNVDPSVHADPELAIRLGWGDPDAHRELARRRQATASPVASRSRSSPPSFTMRWPRRD